MIGHLAFVAVLLLGAVKAHDYECIGMYPRDNEICCGGKIYSKETGMSYECKDGQLYRLGFYCAGTYWSYKQYPGRACCGDSISYDTRTHTCYRGYVVNLHTTPPPTTTPSTQNFYVKVCGIQKFYIDPTVYRYYQCCGNEVYHAKKEYCYWSRQPTYSPWTFNPANVISLIPGYSHLPYTVPCRGSSWVFGSLYSARRFHC